MSPALRHLGWDKDRNFPEPPTLFDNLDGRSRAVKEHDMGIDKTFTELDAKLKPVPGMSADQKKTWDVLLRASQCQV